MTLGYCHKFLRAYDIKYVWRGLQGDSENANRIRAG